MHAVMAALHLVGEGRLRDGQRVGVRHLEHGGDAAHHGAARAGLEVFLVGQAGLAEMHLGVDHAGQDVQAPAVDHLGRPTPAPDRRSRRCGRRRRRCRATPSPSWLTTVPAFRMTSNAVVIGPQRPILEPGRQRPCDRDLSVLRSNAISATCVSRPTNLQENFRMKAAFLPDRGVVKVAARTRATSSMAWSPPISTRLAAGHGPVRRAADAAGQDHRRFPRSRRRPPARRRLPARLPARAGHGACRQARLLQAARQGHGRRPLRQPRRARGLGRRARA